MMSSIFGFVGNLFSKSRVLIIAFALSALYCVIWLLVSFALRNSVPYKLDWERGMITAFINYGDVSIKNFPFLPRLSLSDLSIDVNFVQSNTDSASTSGLLLEFPGETSVEVNYIMDSFKITPPQVLVMDKELKCSALPSHVTIKTFDSVLASLGGEARLVEYPKSILKCTTDKEEMELGFSLTFQQEQLGSRGRLLGLDMHYGNEKVILTLQSEVEKQFDSSAPIVFNRLHLDFTESNSGGGLGINTEEGSPFTLINQFEYLGKLIIDIKNYNHTIPNFISMLSKHPLEGTTQKTIQLLEKYANYLEDGNMVIKLEGREQEMYIGKYGQLQFIQEAFQTFIAPLKN